MTRVGRGRVGYVGEPNVGVTQRIADDGELQIQTPGLMMGYYKNEEATKETITEDGWLRTGDKGELDEMGRLKITGKYDKINIIFMSLNATNLIILYYRSYQGDFQNQQRQIRGTRADRKSVHRQPTCGTCVR